MQNTVIFVVFSLSWCSFVTVPSGMECNKEGLVAVWNWFYRGYIYDVWNCKYRSAVKLFVLSCWSVACGSACCVPTLSVQLCKRV